MARTMGKLTVLAVQRAKQRGLYGDGGGLYLQIARNGSKSWLFRYGAGGRRYLGLGPFHTISLAEARDRARDARKLLLDGQDPIHIRRAGVAAARLEAAKAKTFEQCADAYIASHRAAWKNKKHADQWRATLATYVFPVCGFLPVAAIDTSLVRRVLEPIWLTKPETAGRVRGRIERVVSWATVQGYRQGENPARWRGHLDHLLPARSKVSKVQHHAALPYAEIGAFLADLRGREAIAARALEFCVLTATRTAETLGATWDEIDTAARVWIIPASRMKAGRDHRVPLADAALAVLDAVREHSGGAGFVFPGQRRGRPLSNMALLMQLRRLGRGDLTTHGFRSTFRDWISERTAYPREIAEAALAHAIELKVEAAYRRGDLFDKRRRLMGEWAEFCSSTEAPAGAVLPMERKAGGE